MRKYQKIIASFKPEVQPIWDGDIIVEEKIDGSQFRIEIDDKGNIQCGSRTQELGMLDSMFKKGVDEMVEVFKDYKAPAGTLTYIYGEYLSKPKQNAIPYARTPKHYIIIFDVQENKRWLRPKEKEEFAMQFDLEAVPVLWEGDGKEFTAEVQEKILKQPSILGHQAGFNHIEGFVIKTYDRFYNLNEYPQYKNSDFPWLSCKVVNDEFKEKNKEENPNRGQKLQDLKDAYRTEARVLKAIQYCRDRGELKGDLSDLQFIIPRMSEDIVEENKEDIKNALWKMFGKEIVGYALKIAPEVYKKVLYEEVKQ